MTTPSDAIRQTECAVMVNGVILGVGLMGALDTIVFHQLLQWHNFYADTTETWRVFSDGVFHTFTTTLLFVGAYRIWLNRHRFAQLIGARVLWAGVALGAGDFNCLTASSITRSSGCTRCVRALTRYGPTTLRGSDVRSCCCCWVGGCGGAYGVERKDIQG